MRKMIALLLALCFAVGLVACGKTEGETTPKETETQNADGRPVAQTVGNAYPDKAVGFQTEAPEKGETVAILHTSMGDIKVRFFEKAAPKTVENFVTHAKNGYFDGLTFHRVVNDFMIQGGDPKGNGTGGESIWGSKFEDEFDEKLLNIRGSLAMANSGVNTNGSQFFINQAGPGNFKWESLDYDTQLAQYQQVFDYYTQAYGDQFSAAYPTFELFLEKGIGGISPLSYAVPDAVVELYRQVGGNINLDGAFRAKGGHTVFGQVYEGMDVVDAIAAVEVDENSKPTTAVVIDKVEITTY